MIIVAIDPGISGALACYDRTGLLAVSDMPIVARGGGKAKVSNEVSGAGLAVLLMDWSSRFAFASDKVLVVIERISAMPGQGVAGMFSMGDTFGCIRGVVAAKGYSHELITPQKWKKHFGFVAVKKGDGQTDTAAMKEMGRARAIQLFPHFASVLSRKADHNRAEAMLMAKYGYEVFA